MHLLESSFLDKLYLHSGYLKSGPWLFFWLTENTNWTLKAAVIAFLSMKSLFWQSSQQTSNLKTAFLLSFCGDAGSILELQILTRRCVYIDGIQC